ncbi:MAG: hypothetical protein IJS09_02540 [Treponema sp.]|nr:hypothetical protein [Treponema sp.]
MKKYATGKQVFLDGEAFYKIEDFDAMDDFFMTITSSSDVWNFCWAQGGISAGRKNCDYPIFPYYTCDKLKDEKGTTGSVTIIKIKSEGKRGIIWQPFENLFCTGAHRYTDEITIRRNLYKSLNGSKIWFEEVNLMAGVAFRYGWTSSATYGLVKMSRIENLTDKKVTLTILDGCRNIMPSSCDNLIQTTKSVLLDAYKKAEVDMECNAALFTLSSIVTDKAEPSESLTINVSWFTTKDPVILSENAINYFLTGRTELLQNESNELNGKRGECYIMHESELVGKSAECWEQVLDVNYDATKLAELEIRIKNRADAWKLLLDDIENTENKLNEIIASADGVQLTGNEIADIHHRTNVMFNSMRGGIFADEGKIRTADFISFAKLRDKRIGEELEDVLKKSALKNDLLVRHEELQAVVFAGDNPWHKRMFLEYLPLTFSRRHGDPSRPWNRFSIDLTAKDGSDVITYEGNWRDIVQTWEALLWSFPEYAAHVCSVFVNAMTVEGFNPYRISRAGIDWEIPEEGNPWAQFGYWGDHQVVYLQKLLEFLAKYDKSQLLGMMNEKVFSTAHIPYRIKSYKDICADPRNSIRFDYELNKSIKKQEKSFGMDARCILQDDKLQLTTLSTKVIQLLLAKLLNHIPGAGIWMNTQRPEWNDANNALAGYGASVVTMCYLHRMLRFFIDLCKKNERTFAIENTVYKTLEETADLYRSFYTNTKTTLSSHQRKEFTDKAGAIFEKERDVLYKDGFSADYKEISSEKLGDLLRIFEKAIASSIRENQREDGLFHSYNSLIIGSEDITVVNLKLMLEGQVAILSCDLLNKEEKEALTDRLRHSDLFEEQQHSYMLYPVSRLPGFKEKNCLKEADLAGLKDLVKRTGNAIFTQDINDKYHFNAAFRNKDVMQAYLEEKGITLTEEEKTALFELYEKTFNHQSFMGRSGTFYAYEGLGCIYWHMVSKLLLAVRENISTPKDSLMAFYKDIKKGLGSSKTPAAYGAFPYDPYSHTPFGQGARQPGMTGQVKEEIIARWKELGLDIQDGQAVFTPAMAEKTEYDYDGRVQFTWCGTTIVYDANQNEAMVVTFQDGRQVSFGTSVLPKEESRLLFTRNGSIAEIRIGTK